jgi:hypothetical protein
MKYQFEAYILSEELTIHHLDALYKSLVRHLGSFGKFEITFSCTDNVIRYFVSCDKDVGSISNGLEGLLLRPTPIGSVNIPKTTSKESLVQLVTGGNLLDLKERYNIKRSRDLQIVRFGVRMLGPQQAIVSADLYFKAGQSWTKAHKTMTSLPLQQLAVNFTGNTHYLKKEIPKYLNIEKSLHLLSSQNVNALFKVDTFPYFAHDYYLNLTAYDFDKHSFIVGASGSGKSKLISLLVDRLSKTALKMNYRVVVIDPHASIADDFRHIPEQRVITFGMQDGADLFPGAGTDLTSATELTATLFKSVLGDQFNSRLDRLLRYALFVLMTAQTMTLENLKRFLTDTEYRNQVVRHVEGYVPQNVIKYFGADFNEARTQYYEVTILPLVSMVDEMQLQPSLVGESETSLARVIQENFLTVFSLNKVSMGEKVVKTVAGLLIQQIFLLAQSRMFGQKIILVIDEVSVVQNPAIAQILAEARKFNLTIILSQQYFGQVDKDLRDAIFANVYNYYTFKVSEDDARLLEGNLNIEIPKEIVEAQHAKGISESETRVKLMTELHPRQCLVRVLANGQIAPALKAMTVDAPAQTTQTTPTLKPLQQALPQKFIEQQQRLEEPKQTSSTLSPQPTSHSPGSLQNLLSLHSSSRASLKKKDKS